MTSLAYVDFKASLATAAGRLNIGMTISEAQAALILSDESVSRAFFDGWVANPLGPIAPSSSLRSIETPQSVPVTVPGRVSGFVLGIIGIVFVSIPVVCLPVAITGFVKSRKARRLLPVGSRGRGLATAGWILCIVAVPLDLMLVAVGVLRAITAAYQGL